MSIEDKIVLFALAGWCIYAHLRVMRFIRWEAAYKAAKESKQ